MALLKAAQQIYEKHPNICFHIISLADEEKGLKNPDLKIVD
jgi:hypothetical protein